VGVAVAVAVLGAGRVLALGAVLLWCRGGAGCWVVVCRGRATAPPRRHPSRPLLNTRPTRPPTRPHHSITYDLFNAADEQHENISLAAATEGVDFVLLDEVVRGLAAWAARCQCAAGAQRTRPGPPPHPPTAPAAHTPPLPAPQINPRNFSQSKLDESRAFQNSSILAPRFLAASPYKAPKRKSKGSIDF
jgi:hypothetical protein